MHQEHLELEKLANKALGGFEIDTKTQLRLFNKYEKRLRKHMAVEEKAIFAIKQSLDNSLQILLRQIFSDHQKMRPMIDELRKNIAEEKYQNANEFFSLIKNHHYLEKDRFYAVLDTNLNLEEKNLFKKEIEHIR